MRLSEKEFRRISYHLISVYLDSTHNNFISFYKSYKKENRRGIVENTRCDYCFRIITDELYIPIFFKGFKSNINTRFHELCLDELVKRYVLDGII